jgi:two-component system, response regulator, stage 0 sporulation protein F
MNNNNESTNAHIVLVAEDDDHIRILVTRMLRRAGYRTYEARDGQEAIDKLRDESISAVILDLMMPRVSGFDVIAFLRDHNPERKCVIVLSAAPLEMIEDLDSTIVYARFRKPFDMEAVIDAVRQCVAA